MRTPRRDTALACITASVALTLAASTIDLRAQDISPATSIGQGTVQGAAKLLPTGRILFEASLAREDPAKRGFGEPVSFPVPTCGFAGGLCGAVNRDSTQAVAPEYDWVDSFHDGRALVRSGGLYGYVDTAGRVITRPRYDIAGRFSRGFAQIDIDGKSGLIDLEGRTVLEPRFGFVVPFTDNVFWASESRKVLDGPPGTEQFRFDRVLGVFNGHSDRYVVASSKWGLVDRSGSWLRPPEFSSVSFFDPDNTALMLVTTDSGWGVIRPDGSWQIKPKFQHLGQLVGGLAVAQRDGHWGFVDASGQIRIEPKYDFTYGFAPAATVTAARVNKSFGMIDRSGAWVVEPQYDMILPGAFLIPRSWWTVKRGGKLGLLDESGRLVIGPQFDQTPRRCADGRIVGVIDGQPRLFTAEGTPVEPSQGQLWWPASCEVPHVVKVGDKFAYANRDLSLITPPKFDQAGAFFDDRLAAAKVDGKFGMLRRDGGWALEPTLDAVSSGPADGTLLAKAGDKSGIIDASSGAWVIPPRFDGICAIGPGLIMALTDGKRGVLNTAGAWLIEPKYSRIGIRLEDGLVPALLGDRWGYVDGAGTLVIDARYDEPSFFDHGIAWAKAGASWCPIDRRGQPIASLQCQPSDPLTRETNRVFDCRIGR
jgi:WG containing repeat